MSQFIRITKREAQRRFIAGDTIVLCPCKLRPGFPFAPHVPVNGKRHRSEAYGNPTDAELWKRMYNNYCFYNSSWETGYYPHYYLDKAE